MTTRKEPPKQLLEVRPAVGTDPNHQHPSTGPALGKAPPRYSRPVHDAIINSIKMGHRPAQAAALAGITADNYYSWIRKGREGHPHLWEFAQDVELALAEVEGKAVASIVGAGATFENAENAKWFLERRFSDGYSKEAATKVNAMLEDFFKRLEMSLPPDVFQMVIAAAAGQTLPNVSGPVAALASGDDDDSDGSEEEAQSQ